MQFTTKQTEPCCLPHCSVHLLLGLGTMPTPHSLMVYSSQRLLIPQGCKQSCPQSKGHGCGRTPCPFVCLRLFLCPACSLSMPILELQPVAGSPGEI